MQFDGFPLSDAITLTGAAVAWFLTARLERVKNESLQSIARTIRFGLIPVLLGLIVIENWFAQSGAMVAQKLFQTALSIICLWIAATALKGLYFLNTEGNEIRPRTPRLLVDIVRLAIVTVGGLLLSAQIWNKDLSPLLTTFGVGSLVLGLALQDTLGNLFSGLSLVSERPFCVGDWIQVGDISGKVLQVNWRAVRIQTRELDEVTVPNSALSKERITNYSRPSQVSGVKVHVGFDYDTPPNYAREVLLRVAHETKGILHSPPVDVRVLEYSGYSIAYEVRFFITEYDSLPQIKSRFMTQLWYAVRRAGIKIPYPIQHIFKTEIHPHTSVVKGNELSLIMRQQELFAALSAQELKMLAESAQLLQFAAGEVVIHQAEEGQELYVIIDGVCTVTVKQEEGPAVTLARLTSGDTFGEMSLLAGEPRSANVSAESDITVARISRDAIREILQTNQALQETFVAYIAKRSAATKEVLETLQDNPGKTLESSEEHAILARLRRFFRL